MAYTSPPPTAEPLLKEKPFGECICQLSTPAMPDYQAPVAADSAAGRRACAARPKGKYSRERMALAPIRARRIFPATGAGRQVARATPCFHPIDFYVTHRFFGTFLTQGSTVIPVSPLVSPHQNAPGRISAGRNEFALEAAVEGAALTAYARSPRGRTDRPCRPP